MYLIAEIFRGWKLSQIAESQIFALKTFANCGKRLFVGVAISNEIELVWTRWGGYCVYVAVWEAAVGQVLPCHRVGGNIHDPYTVAVVENSDMPIDNDAPVLNEKFHG